MNARPRPRSRSRLRAVFAFACLMSSLLLISAKGAAYPPKAHKVALPAPPPVDPEGVEPAYAWSKPEAFQLASAGTQAAQSGDVNTCVAKDQASIALEDRAHTRLHLASCEARSGHYLAALADALRALKMGTEQSDAPSVEGARVRIAEFLRHIAHVVFVLPPGISDLQLTFDGKPVLLETAAKKFAVDPGVHEVHAEGTLSGLPVSFDKTYEISDGDLVTAAILLVPRTSEFLSGSQLRCILGARNQTDIFKCLPQSGAHFVERAGVEMGAYSDTDHVEVLSPMITGSVASPTQGWNVGGSYLVDVVSAASPDIVSEASPPFHEVRQAGTLTGGYKPDIYGFQASADVSSEPDYLSVGGGLALSADLDDKLITPRIEYDYSHDTIGRGGTPFSVFHHTFQVHEVDAGLTFVVSARALFIVNGTLQFERGDQSKPYRYVPMFSPEIAPFIPRGASVGLVNGVRLPMRLLEQLPLSRDRYAISGRFAYRFKTSTLRLEQRLYMDSWQQMATTTDLQYLIDVGTNLRIWPHVRVNAQNGANFYRLAYTVNVPATVGGALAVPSYRTTDRELSPLLTGVFGAGARIALSPPMASTQYGISLQTDVMATHYFDALYLTGRIAIYGTLGLDGEFQ